MKRFFTITTLLSLAYVLFVSNENGPSGKYTGAPGDNGTCFQSTCHSGGQGCNFTAESNKITVNFGGNNATKYKNDSTYTITVQIGPTKISSALYGFQGTAKKAIGAGTDTVGKFIPSTNQKVAIPGYISHSTLNTNNVFTFQWKAPSKAQYKDTVKMYFATNEAYRTAAPSPNDDSIRTKSIVLVCDTLVTTVPTSIFSNNLETVSLTPNVLFNQLTVPAALVNKTYSIISVGGQVVSKGKAESVINIADLTPGLYYFHTDKSISTFLKQ
jgi:hypothetical protein